MFKLPKKKIIGITGTMGSGKSQVGKILSEKYSVLDCDKVNAELLLPNHKGFEELKKRKLIKIDKDGYLDKKQLSFDMFQDNMIKKEVEDILHPLIFQEMNTWIKQQRDDLVFIEMPLLFEIGAQEHFDSIWCVVTKRSIALERLTKYRHIDTHEAMKRITMQMSEEKKASLSNIVIYNDGTLKDLKQTIAQMVEREKSWS